MIISYIIFIISFLILIYLIVSLIYFKDTLKYYTEENYSPAIHVIMGTALAVFVLVSIFTPYGALSVIVILMIAGLMQLVKHKHISSKLLVALLYSILSVFLLFIVVCEMRMMICGTHGINTWGYLINLISGAHGV